MLEPKRIRQHDVGRGIGIDGLLFASREIEQPHQRGQWTVQLMRSVIDELELSLTRLFDTAEHGVHRVGELRHLVAGLGNRHTPTQVTTGDFLDALANGVDGSQGSPGREICQQCHDDDDDRENDATQDCNQDHRAIDWVLGGTDEDCQRTVK